MGEGPEQNPFAPPTEAADFQLAHARYDSRVLASYGQRFLAQLIDNLLYFAAAIPGLVLALVLNPSAFDAPSDTTAADEFPVAMLFPAMLGPLLLASFQWNMVAKTGQSFAKRWLRTRIIREDSGAPPGFMNGVVLRVWLLSAAGAIPVVGGCIGLADAFAIFFGDRRQTLHDRIARTIVIQE
jgi:uncharacterized RDD family membrane protein YckC